MLAVIEASIQTENLDACAENKGYLLEEQVAAPIAQIAIEHRKAYFERCYANFSKEYCDQLISRAVHHALAAP